MTGISKKQVVHYVLLPQVMPRIRTLFLSGFGHLAFFMAQVYRTVNLLPANHPYLAHQNIGRYGIRHAIAEAANNLRFKKNNIDQIVIFFVLLIGLVILAIQAFLMAMAILMPVAHAALPDIGYWFNPWKDPAFGFDQTHDISFRIMDRVFGLAGSASGEPPFFNSCVAQGEPCEHNDPGTKQNDQKDYGEVYPWPFHIALRGMFTMYSTGLLVVGLIIFCYFVATVIIETAESGTPFGKRFNNVWAPLRMVAALGLLVPIAQGLNSGQWILMYAAKWGSGFATSGWTYFVDTVTSTDETLLGKQDNLVIKANAPSMNNILEFGLLLATCVIGQKMEHERDIEAYIIKPDGVGGGSGAADSKLLLGPAASPTTFDAAAEFTDSRDIHVVFGVKDVNEHKEWPAKIAPYCGELKLQLLDIDYNRSPGSKDLQDYLFKMLQDIWKEARIDGGSPATATSAAVMPDCPGPGIGGRTLCEIAKDIAKRYLPKSHDPSAPLVNIAELKSKMDAYQSNFADRVADARDEQKSAEWTLELRKLGWGGAAIWYNKISQFNGTYIAAAQNLPTVKRYPMVMEEIWQWKRQHDAATGGQTRFEPRMSNGTAFEPTNPRDKNLAIALYQTYTRWPGAYSSAEPSGNIFIDIIVAFFGIDGLLSMRENIEEGVQPLVVLTGVGKALVESSIRNLGIAAGSGLAGGIINILSEHSTAESILDFVSSVTQIVGLMGLGIGFVLYYLIPFMPFIYFFFAVGGWVKGIFEAMVGVPLWALAHIRIDGEGFMGEAAQAGYYLILEIFLRPILIIWGLIGSITILSAQVSVLNDIWSLVTSNVTGFEETSATGTLTGSIRYLRGPVDNFFYTVIYAIIVYMLAMSAFKLVDLIPNHIMRWMGANVSTFGDQAQDPAQNLVRNVSIGGNMVSQGFGATMEGSKGVMKGVGDSFRSGLSGRNQS